MKNSTFDSHGLTSIEELPLALTVLEAGAVLRIGRNTVYELVRCGRLRSLKIGRNIRIPRDAIAEFLSVGAQ